MIARGLRNRPRRLVQIMLRVGQNRLQLLEQTITVTPEGIEYRNIAGHRFLRWFAILRVQATEKHAFIYTDLLHAFVVPARAFDTLVHFNRFVEVVNGHLAKAQAYGLICPKCQYDLRGEIVAGCPECGWRREEA
jgi:hypothetical protein